MKELVELLAKSLVDQPDQIQVEKIENHKSVLIEIKAAPEDMGKIIGRQGRIIKAIRTLARSAAPLGTRVAVELVEE